MISVNFTQLNESLKIFILSVAVGSETVVRSLIETANRHLDQLECITKDTPNAKLHFDCSTEIIMNTYISLRYINSHSVDLFSSEPVNILDVDLDCIEKRFTAALARIKKEVF